MGVKVGWRQKNGLSAQFCLLCQVLHVLFMIRVKRVVLNPKLPWTLQLCAGAATLIKIPPRFVKGLQ